MTKIHFIITGGTIDGLYQPATETSEPGKKSVIPHYIKDVIKPHFAATFKTVCMLDSSDITDAIRRKIVNAADGTAARHIIVTHGTNTMTKTANFLKKHMKKKNKIVILTGAMMPLKEFALSDGGFNIGLAIGALERLKPGVYIAMNGQVFAAGRVRKNFKKARFEISR